MAGLTKKSITAFMKSKGLWNDLWEDQVEQYMFYSKQSKEAMKAVVAEGRTLKNSNGIIGTHPQWKAHMDCIKQMQGISTKLGLSNKDLKELGVDGAEEVESHF